jgi:hypothetical protein
MAQVAGPKDQVTGDWINPMDVQPYSEKRVEASLPERTITLSSYKSGGSQDVENSRKLAWLSKTDPNFADRLGALTNQQATKYSPYLGPGNLLTKAQDQYLQESVGIMQDYGYEGPTLKERQMASSNNYGQEQSLAAQRANAAAWDTWYKDQDSKYRALEGGPTWQVQNYATNAGSPNAPAGTPYKEKQSYNPNMDYYQSMGITGDTSGSTTIQDSNNPGNAFPNYTDPNSANQRKLEMATRNYENNGYQPSAITGNTEDANKYIASLTGGPKIVGPSGQYQQPYASGGSAPIQIASASDMETAYKDPMNRAAIDRYGNPYNPKKDARTEFNGVYMPQ